MPNQNDITLNELKALQICYSREWQYKKGIEGNYRVVVPEVYHTEGLLFTGENLVDAVKSACDHLDEEFE